MNSLTTTKSFEPIKKVFKLDENILNPNFSLKPYLIDYELYEYLPKLYRGYKFPLASETIKYIEGRQVLPVLFGDPADTKDKRIMFTTTIPSILKPINKEITAIVDISAKGKYERNQLNKVPEFLKIEERSFFTFMQSGMLNKIFHDYDNAFTYNIRFVRTVVEIYAFLMQKCISSVYPVSSTVSEAEILTFICAVYALQNFFGQDIDKARDTALGIRGIERSNIVNNCKYYLYNTEDIDMRPGHISNKLNEGKAFPIDVFVEILSIEFPYIKSGHLEARTLIDRYTSMYGSNSLFAIEHFFSFFNMLVTATMRINMYTDLLIEKGAGPYVNDLLKLVVTVIS